MSGTQIDAGVDMSFRIGQRVRHRDYKGQRVTGIVRSLSIESDQGLIVGIALDAPIVIPAGEGYAETQVWNQHAQAHEFSPFDERDDLLDAAREAAAVLAELYAKYQTKIGPFASQAQRANVLLGAAIAKYGSAA